MNRISLALLGCGLGVVHVGCTDDGNDGTAPTLSELTLTQTEIPVGTQTVVTGSFVFSDPDGDVVNVGLRVTPPDGSPQAPQLFELVDSIGETTAIVPFGAIINPPLAGPYSFDVWVIDLDGHESNHAMIALEAVP